MIIEKDKLLPEEASVVEVTISNLSQSPDLKRSPELHVENISSNVSSISNQYQLKSSKM